jgi:hypothetical protein
MKFSFRIYEIDQEAAHRRHDAELITLGINNFLNQKNYGNDIEEYVIACICVRFRAGYEEWYKVRKPEYVDHKVFKNKLTGQSVEINKRFTQEIRISEKIYERLVVCKEPEARIIFAREIIIALDNLGAMPKKIKDFDRAAFKADLESYFKSQKLMH